MILVTAKRLFAKFSRAAFRQTMMRRPRDGAGTTIATGRTSPMNESGEASTLANALAGCVGAATKLTHA